MRYLGAIAAIATGLLIGRMVETAALLGTTLLVACAIGAWVLARQRAQQPAGADEAWRAFERELSRSRRMERTFSVVRVSFSEPIAAETRKEILSRWRHSTRDIDACWWSDSAVMVLLSETPASRAPAIVSRLQEALHGPANWCIAEYPRDGLTLEALVASLDEQARSGVQVEVTDGAV